MGIQLPETLPQGLKPRTFSAVYGTTQVVPFQNTDDKVHGERTRNWQSLLHCFRALNAQPGQHDDQLAKGDGGGCEQEGFARGVFFGEDVMAVVEVVELLRQLEGVLGEIGRLGGGDALLEHQRAAAGAEPEGPDVFVVFAGEIGRGDR